jgi:Flp pilus assembly protein TadB
MKLFDTILISLSAALMIIGVHQSVLHGLQNSYFIFMMASALFLWYTLRKKNRLQPKDAKSGKGFAQNQTKKRKHK